jgi:hypothetical protein
LWGRGPHRDRHRFMCNGGMSHRQGVRADTFQ